VDLVVRVDRNPTTYAPTIRRIVQSGIAGILIPTVSTVERQLGEFSAQRTLQTVLLAAFAGLALVLAMIGVYGVLHYAVSERTNEIGIRVALGASPADMVAMALRDGVRLPAVGLILGVAAALGAARTLDHLLFRTRSADALTYVLVVVVLGVSALAACYMPARRAASIDPITALRRE
jgi:ABC-type antimicrobial peptide transport system permease subunit